MANESTAQGQVENTPQAEGTTQTAPAGQSGSERTYTQAEVDALMGGYVPQDEVNRIVGKAKREARAKFEGFDEYKAKAEAWADYDDVVNARDEATAKVATLEAQIAHRDLVDKVSDATGVPRSLLKGETEEELTASAEAIKTYAGAQIAQAAPTQPAYPEDKGGGTSPAPMTREQILAEPDTQKRRKLIAENLSLFE